jgi:hypothetical protein
LALGYEAQRLVTRSDERPGLAVHTKVRHSPEKDTPMLLVKVRCRGLTPLLLNRMSEATLEGLRTKTKPALGARQGHTLTPRQEAEPKVYTHDGKPILPAENLMACLIAAGVFCRLDKKRQISTGKATLLPGLMQLQDFMLPIVLPDSNKPAPWEPDVRKGTNPNGGEAVAICRPRFDAWAFECRFTIDTNEIGENVIRDLWDKAGKRVGLCEFRPSRKGIFGQFVIEKWTREEKNVTDQAAE